MHPASCGNWEYKDYPKYSELNNLCIKSLDALRSDSSLIYSQMADTRQIHGNWFGQLTPENQDYLAGNYRGADYECLKFNSVTIAGFLGTSPSLVDSEMTAYHVELESFMETLESKFKELQAAKKNKKIEKRALFIYQLGEIAAAFYVLFLVIHPYANGNGHIARWIVWMMLIRSKHHPQTWPLNSRPPTDDLIRLYRMNDKMPLIQFIIKAIRGH